MRNQTAFLAILTMGQVAPLCAAPVITSVTNAASNIDILLPSGAIAPGSIFIIKGTGLGPANLTIAPTPFQSTSLSGTSVAIASQGSTTVNALMYYTSDTQIAALLPSNAPLGAASIGVTVTYNGQSSPVLRISRGFARSALGLFTVDSSGRGPALVTYPDYSLVSPLRAANCGGPNTTCGAANPGDTLILWGTGLGPIEGNDASGAGLGQDMPNLVLGVRVGGAAARVLYRGRSGCCVGLDQIVFVVPDDAPAGCAVPILVQIAGVPVSNNPVVPIARGGRECAFSDAALASVGGGFQQALANGPVNIGLIELSHSRNDSGPGFADSASFGFLRFQPLSGALAPFMNSATDRPPVGTCILGFGLPNPFDDALEAAFSLVDGGSRFTVSGPNGSQSVMVPPGGESVTLSQAGTFLVPGNYTVTGVGGRDVGAFTANLTVPRSPILLTPNPSSNSFTVSKAAGMSVTWNPNGSMGQVEIVLEGFVDRNRSASVLCRAPATTGTFTVPAYLLSAIPTGTGVFRFSPGSFSTPASSGSFSAPGIVVGIAQTYIDGTLLGSVTITN